jgi:hypothetical protein
MQPHEDTLVVGVVPALVGGGQPGGQRTRFLQGTPVGIILETHQLVR